MRLNQDIDHNTINEIEQEGSDLTKPMDVEFLISFESLSTAEEAASHAKVLEYNVKIEGDSEDKSITLYCMKTMLLEIDELLLVQEKVDSLADMYNGETRGWSTPGNVGNHLDLSYYSSPSVSSDVPARKKLLLVCLSWVAGMMTASFHPAAIGWIVLFPTGFWALPSVSHFRNAPLEIAILTGWLGFGVLTVVTLFQGHRKAFYTLWVILTLLLIVNGAGCNRVLTDLNSI